MLDRRVVDLLHRVEQQVALEADRADEDEVGFRVLDAVGDGAVVAVAEFPFEEHPPYSNAPGAKEFIDLYHERAAKAGIPDTNVEVQAAASYTAWQLLEAAVRATNSLDDAKLAAWLRANKVDTIQGKLRFDGPSNYGDDLMRVKQVQNGRWVTVYPKEYAAPGATLIVQ